MYIKILGKLLLVCLMVVIGLIMLYFLYSHPWQRSFFLQPLHRLNTSDKIVALTFDDGPNPARTPPLLDLLDKHNIKASFFFVGKNIETYPEIAQETVNRGHLVGNHSYSHQRLILKTPAFVRHEISQTNQLLSSIGVSHPLYFRPPNNKKFIVLPWVLRALDMTLVTGTYDPEAQYQIPYPADEVAEQVVENAKPGSIIFLHDGRSDSVPEFIEAVDTIILRLQSHGYSFTTLDQPL